MSEIPDYIQEEIDEVKAGRSKMLSFSHTQLTEIPDEVFELTGLEKLDIQRTKITNIPAKIKQLKRLKVLDIRGTEIEVAPDIPGLILNYGCLLRSNVAVENVIGLRLEGEGKVDVWPEPIFELPNLISLELTPRKNNIIPSNIARLSQLEALELSRNNLITIPAGIFQLSNLKFLNLDNNGLTELPAKIVNLSKLSELKLSKNPLNTVPTVIQRLKGLKKLDLSGVGLSCLPEWLAELKALEHLWCSNNKLKDLPASISELKSLAFLSLSQNPLRQIPKSIFELKSLRGLWLWDVASTSQITEIPADILKLKNLNLLDVEGQPIQTPPPEVVKKGIGAIRDYYLQLESGKDYLCEAKLIIVGEGGAGKTSLAKKIEDPTYELSEEQGSTEGIDVIEWPFPTTIEVDNDGTKETINKEFRVNIWDFGGQEIYHSTHQFFLTKRSLYILLADNRKEDTDFNYWLNVIELLSDGSPVLIVKNEKQDRKRDINLARLQQRFGNLVQVLSTNLATNRGLEEITTAIRQQVVKLPHIGTPLPKTWKVVREVLESDSRDHITLEQYFELCKEHDFTSISNNLQLSDYLHDLGICLHFQDDDLLKQTVILKPTWGTDAVYRVLDNKKVLANHGRFDRSDLEAIWSEPKYQNMHEQLLQLMMKFQLCYQIADTDAYIAPQLLEVTQPEYDWDCTANLTLKYRYDFMPKGIITRFIVALHPLIVDQELVWKDGVVLTYEGSQAQVIEDYTQREITVRVQGSNKKGFLDALGDELKKIHNSYPQLQFDRYLPCNCSTCVVSDTPNYYPYKILQRFSQDKKEIQCHFSYEMVDAELLIEKVLIRYILRDEAHRAKGHVDPELMSAISRPSLLTLTGTPIKQAKPNIVVTQVTLQNIRCFENLDIKLTDTNGPILWSMVLGDNSAGKTTLLRSIALGLCREGDATALLKDIPGSLVRKDCQSGKITLQLSDTTNPAKTYSITTEIIKEDGGGEIVRQQTTPKENLPWPDIFVCGYGIYRSGKADAPHDAYSTREAVKSLFDYQTPMQNPEVVLLKRNKATRGKLEKMLLQILMLDEQKDQLSYPETGFEITGPWGQQPASVLSDGYQVTLRWVMDFIGWLIYAKRLTDSDNIGGILLLDEIEQHLHPRWQRFIVDRLRKQFPNTQIIATTHTRFAVSGVVDIDNSVLMRLEHNEQCAVTARIIDKSNIEGKRADQVLVSEAFGLLTTRNPGSKDVIDRYSELLGQSARTANEQTELESLSARLQAALVGGESPLECKIDKAVEDALERVLNNASPAALDDQAKAELRALFDFEDE
ncbi:MAG: leucine-rich repeat domain-containing protein [Algicola sp.]|nr:leucine-rich repeat domain-containing protein [Algicola sp.]